MTQHTTPQSGASNNSSHNLSPSDIKNITETRGIDLKWAIANCRRVSDRQAEFYLGYPAKSPGILFVGSGTQYQFKPDEPWGGSNGKKPKYRTPTKGEGGYDAFLPNHPTSKRYWDVELLKQHCWMIDGIPFLVLTEGVFKALAGCSNGLPTISLLGVTMGLVPKDKAPEDGCWLVPLLKEYAKAGFGFVITFDADAKTNKNVRDAERNLMSELLRFGIPVFSATGCWEVQEGKGMDDFIKIKGVEEFKSRVERFLKSFSSGPRVRKNNELSQESTPKDALNPLVTDGYSDAVTPLFAPSPMRNYAQKAEAALFSDGHWISIAGQLYLFSGSHYELQSRAEQKRRIRGWLNTYVEKVKGVYRYTQAKSASVNEVYEWVALGVAVDLKDVNPPGLNCSNGVIRINPDGSHSLVPHNPSLIYTYVGCKYDPSADPADCDRLLECLEPQQREIFLRTIAASLCLPLARLKMSRVKGLLCHGDGSNGKDTLRTALVAVLGRGVTGKSLRDFQIYDTGRKFPLAGLENSLCNWSSENADTVSLEKVQSLKQFITGDELTIEHKGLGEYPYKPEAIFLANCNVLPSISSDAEAIRSRYCILSFKKTYAVKADIGAGQLEADPRFKEDPSFVLERIAPALLNTMLGRIPLIFSEGIDYDSSNTALREAQEKSQHLWQFVRDLGYEAGQGDRVYAKDLWRELSDWYVESGVLEIEYSDKGKEKPIWNDLPNKYDKPVKAINQVFARFSEIFPKLEKYRHTEGNLEDSRTKGEAYYLGISKQSFKKSGKSSSPSSPPHSTVVSSSPSSSPPGSGEDDGEATILTQSVGEDGEDDLPLFREIIIKIAKLNQSDKQQLTKLLTGVYSSDPLKAFRVGDKVAGSDPECSSYNWHGTIVTIHTSIGCKVDFAERENHRGGRVISMLFCNLRKI